MFQKVPLLASRLFEYAALDFGERQSGNEEIDIALLLEPRGQRFRGERFSGVADDVCVEQKPRHRSTLRPLSNGRWTSSSASPFAMGDRRRAAYTPPLPPGSLKTLRLISVRMRAASASF